MGGAGTYIAYKFDLFTAEPKARAEDDAADILDAEKPAFDWKMNPALDASVPGYSWTLDHRLTPAEQKELAGFNGDDKGAIWSFVKRLGGRRDLDEAATYHLQLTSERQKPVLITKLTAAATRCWTPTAKTSIVSGPGATEPWDEVHFNLSPTGAPAPAMAFKVNDAAPEEAREEVRFNKAVSLGGTQSPGLLAVTPLLSAQKDCEWKIDLEFNVNSGKTERKSIAKDDSGKKLVVYGMRGGAVETWTWGGAGSGWTQ